MPGQIKFTVPEQLSAQAQIHQSNSDLHQQTSGAVLNAHSQMAGSWQGGGFDEISQYFQAYAQHLATLANLHQQTGTNLNQARANNEGAEVTNTQGMH